MRAPRKILLIANTDWYLYNFRISLAKRLAQEAWHVALASPPGRFAPRLSASGLHWHALAFDRKDAYPHRELGFLLRLQRLYRAERPDIVHHFTMKPLLYGTFVARISKVPIVINSVAGLGTLFMAKGGWANLRRGLAIASARWVLASPRVRVVFEHAGDRDYFLARRMVAPGRAHLIRGVGVDLDRFSPTPEPQGEPLVMMVSRLLWDKGVAEFVEAAREIRTRRPGARMILVGEPDYGNPTSITSEQAQSWVEEGVIEWWGYREDMPNVYAASHVVVLPSYGEGIPTVLLEAGASGRAIVATDIPGCRELVRHGASGLLVPVGDASALAQAICRLIEDPEMRKRMGREGRSLVERSFGQESIDQQMLQLYEEALETIT